MGNQCHGLADGLGEGPDRVDIRSLLKSRFARGVYWNLLSLFCLGIAGVVLNVGIGRFYGPSALGVFNQVFALYILVSQLAVFGIWLSTLKHVSEFAADRGTCSCVVSAALIAVGVTATVFTVLSLVCADLFGTLLESPGVTVGWLCVLPGVWCYAVNKVLMAVLNGHRNMRAYALSQIGRYTLMVLLLVFCVVRQAPSWLLPGIIGLPEIALCFALLIYTRRHYDPVISTRCMDWVKRHLAFGVWSLPSGAMAELNTRVDVLMLGYFCSDRLVGIYSMAAMIVEGLAQIPVAFRDNVNPILTRLFVEGRFAALERMVRQGCRLFMFGMTAVSVLAVGVYPILLGVLVGRTAFAGSWEVFAVLMIAFALSSGYVPFNMLLVQAGRPGLHTGLKTGIVLTNIVLNILLIPRFGVMGAAFATGGSFILAVAYLKLITRRFLDVTI